MVCCEIQLAAVARLALALAQFLDFLGTSGLERVRIALSKIGFLSSKPKRYNF
jgi:hypothetical protein